jgi:hypothetical protein
MKKIRRSVRYVLLAAIAALMLVSNLTYATESQSSPDRVLGGHTFIPSASVPDPFVSTKFGTSTGVGLGTMDLPNSVAHYTAGTYNLAVLGEKFDLQLGLVDLVALSAKLSGFVFSGINEEGILNTGASVGYNYELGATVKLLRLEKFQLAESRPRNPKY